MKNDLFSQHRLDINWYISPLTTGKWKELSHRSTLGNGLRDGKISTELVFGKYLSNMLLFIWMVHFVLVYPLNDSPFLKIDLCIRIRKTHIVCIETLLFMYRIRVRIHYTSTYGTQIYRRRYDIMFDDGMYLSKLSYTCIYVY